MRATSPAVKTRRRTVEAERSKPVAVLQRRLNSGWSCTFHHGHGDKVVVIACCGHIKWSSTCYSLRTTLFSPLVPYTHNCRSSMPCTSHNVMVWQTSFLETNYSASFECTHLLILRPFASTRHTCTSFHVSTLFGSSELSEQCITLTMLMTHEMSLLGLCVSHLSEIVRNILSGCCTFHKQ